MQRSIAELTLLVDIDPDAQKHLNRILALALDGVVERSVPMLVLDVEVFFARSLRCIGQVLRVVAL